MQDMHGNLLSEKIIIHQNLTNETILLLIKITGLNMQKY